MQSAPRPKGPPVVPTKIMMIGDEGPLMVVDGEVEVDLSDDHPSLAGYLEDSEFEDESGADETGLDANDRPTHVPLPAVVAALALEARSASDPPAGAVFVEEAAASDAHAVTEAAVGAPPAPPLAWEPRVAEPAQVRRSLTPRRKSTRPRANPGPISASMRAEHDTLGQASIRGGSSAAFVRGGAGQVVGGASAGVADTLARAAADGVSVDVHDASSGASADSEDSTVRVGDGGPTSTSDRRRSPRYHIAERIDVGREGSLFYTGVLENISGNGLFICSFDVDAHRGDIYHLEFRMPDGYCVQTRAEVAWLREFRDDVPDVPPGVGLRFLNLSPEAEERINAHIAREGSLLYED